MANLANKLAVTTMVLVLFMGFETAHGIECFRCISTNSSGPFLCNEFLLDEQLDSLTPDSCDDVYDAKYCVKQIGRFEGGIGTKRFCSSANLGNYCDYVQQPGDKLSYRTCVYTCDSDGCNSATGVSPATLLLSIATATTIFFMR